MYDVLIDHVSFVATYRSEFARILQREPYAGLVERLRKQSGASPPWSACGKRRDRAQHP